MSIAIIGGGIAGAAAAFEIARQGGRASVFHGAVGSSGLYSGALDFVPWDQTQQPGPIATDLAQFAAELGVWSLDSALRQVATPEGNVRPARGADSALLDLERCAGKRVAVVELERDDWDAALLAKSFADSAWARQTSTRFYPVRVAALQHGFERRISAYDLARLHDSPERAAALLAALQRSDRAPDAWLFGPWLGITRDLARELGQALAVPVGETSSAPGGTAGARFEHARDRLLTRVADVTRGRVLGLAPLARETTAYRMELASGSVQEFGAVVLATGGVAAGGVVLERSFERRGGSGFGLSFRVPFSLELDGEILEGVSSLSSIDFVERGLGALLRVGIGTAADGSLREHPGLFAAGDARAGQPRSALASARSGLLAARSALDFVRRSH